MKSTLFLSCIFLVSCADQEPYCPNSDSIIKNVCIYKNDFEINDSSINRALDIIHWNWYEKFGHDEAEIIELYIDEEGYSQVELRFRYLDNYLGLASGTRIELHYGDKQQQCFANAAIGHEFIHVLGYLFNMNYGHDNRDLFLSKKMVEDCSFYGDCDAARSTLENKINVEMCDLFCYDSCLWWRVK